MSDFKLSRKDTSPTPSQLKPARRDTLKSSTEKKKGCLMSKVRKDEVRENRIMMEIIVDAYGSEEQAMGWYYYLDDTLSFPFLAKCITKRAISPLRVGDEVEVIGIAPEEECEHEMFVIMRWERNGLAVPLMQLELIHGNDQTREAIEDWHYWINRGYQFG